MIKEEKVLSRYFNKQGLLKIDGFNDEAFNDLQMINGRQQFDDRTNGGPDFYSKKNNTILIIEHFEFDASKRIAGSESKIVIDHLDKEIEKANPPYGETYQLDQKQINHPIRNYIDNALKSFEDHSMKISRYKTNLEIAGIINSESAIKVCFIAEDTTICGSYYYDGEDRDGIPAPALLLPLCYEFLNMFENQNIVDSMFCLSSYND